VAFGTKLPAISTLLFLTSAALLIFAAIRLGTTSSRNAPNPVASGDDSALAPITGIATSATRKHKPIKPIDWQSTAAQVSIRVMPKQTRQPILGFGAALTGSACAVLERMKPENRKRLLEDLLAPDRMNLNVVRTSIGSSDYSPSLYSYCDSNQPDPQLSKFSIDPDKPFVLPILREALDVNPELFYFSSPWSPPGWMKPNGTMLGGAMDNRHFPAYAQYFVKFLEAYRAAGIPVRAVTVQNEVQADQGGLMPACTWTTELECEFVRDHLGPALKKAGFADVAIWMMDHNYDMEERAKKTLGDAGLRAFCNAIAWHGYGGTADAAGRVHDAHPTSEQHFTEFNTFIDAPQYSSDWTFWGTQIGEAMRNRIRDYVMWNIVLDEHGKPNIGPFTCGGIVTVKSATDEVIPSGGYWGLGHYSRFVRRGAHSVDSTGTVEKLTHAAFRNPNGSMVLVLSNAGEARSVTIECVDDGRKPHFAKVEMEADSVITLTWSEIDRTSSRPE
jgi:O-Glycosyl hydrolase